MSAVIARPVSAPLRGLPLLDAAIAQIEAHPETWTQDSYRCRSGMCLAGWVAALDGCEFEGAPDSYDGEFLLVREDDPEGARIGGVIHIHDRARLVLGITAWQAEELFSGGNTLEHIKDLRDEFRAAAADRAEEVRS